MTSSEALWRSAFLFAATLAAGTAAPTEPAPRIRTSVTAFGEAWQNTGGGLQTGTHWNGLADLRSEWDVTQGGNPSGVIVAQVHWVQSQGNDVMFSSSSGAFHPVSNTLANNHLRVFNLHYRREMPSGVAWKVGQLAADDDFMGSEYAALFANASFGSMPSQVATPLATAAGGDAAFPIFPVAAPGAWLKLEPSTNLMWQTGVYYGGPGPDSKANWGFHYASAADSGIALFSELRCRGAINGRAATTRFGVAAHSGRFDKLSATETGDTPVAVRGLYSVYAVQDVALAVTSTGETRVGAFVRAGVSPLPDRSVVTWYADAGTNWLGPLPGRANDVLGAAIGCTHLGNHYRTASDSARMETTIEITYRAQLMARVTAQADVQFLFNPARRSDSGRRETATVVGIRTIVAF